MRAERNSSPKLPVTNSTAPGGLSSTLLKGRYRLIARLGEGGMGVTFRAWDAQKGIPVVIKMPREEVRNDQLIMDRFAREVSTMLALSHEHIVPITDHGEESQCPFVAMRFLPGGSLSEYRAKETAGHANQVPPSSLHFWLPGIASALDFIHANGVLHRDVKPGNVFLDAFLRPFLGDFGIAKVVDESGGLNRETTLTATRMAIGTPEYMGPEIFRPGAILDGRVDQYALGVIVYELLSGRKPFLGESAHIIVEHVSKDVPPLRDICPDIQRRMAEAVHRALSKHPEERFPTCRDFAEAVLAQIPSLKIDTSRARLLCPQCKVILRVSMSAAGRMGTCPRCASALFVADDLGSLWLNGEDRSTASVNAPESAEFVAEDPVLAIGTTSIRGFFSAVGHGWPGNRRWSFALAAAVLGMLGGFALRSMSGQSAAQPSNSNEISEVLALRQRMIQQQASLEAALSQVRQLEEQTQADKERSAMLYRANHELVLQNRRLTNTPLDGATGRTTITSPSPRFAEPHRSVAKQPGDVITNSIGMRFKLIYAGTFLMGNADGELNDRQHQVTITENFYMGVYEVSNAQWKRVMGSAPSRWWKDDTLPVEQVSWDDARKFCESLSALPQEHTAGRVYRLPTEAEWEYACRANTATMFSFGDDESQLDDFGWFGANALRQTHPVGQKKPNAWGLYDMHGNVAEWCSDWHSAYPYGSVTNPRGPSNGLERVCRGGSWHHLASFCRSSRRDGSISSYRYSGLGLRLAISSSESGRMDVGRKQ